MNLRELFREDVKPNAYEKLKAEFPNLSTLIRFVPGIGQAMAVADAASAINMYQKTMADIEQKYPAIVNTLKPDPHLDNADSTEINPIEESERQPDLIQAFKDFLPVAMQELKIKQLPRIRLQKHIPQGDQPTFGKFVNDENTIYMGIEDRQPLDTLRTLAHELVHFKQYTQHKLGKKSGDTGSPEEDDAHKIAGVIMRHFGKKFPGYFKDEALDID